MKSDLVNFTHQTSEFSAEELEAFLDTQRELAEKICRLHEGEIIKGEGDSYWILFPSVLAAVLFAKGLILKCSDQSGACHFNGVRVAITVGDILLKDGDIFGEPVNLAARIESVTPPNEIYLSDTAWNCLNRSKIQASVANRFQFKGFKEEVRVYKIEGLGRTRHLKNQVIVGTDLRSVIRFSLNHTERETERLLDGYSEVIEGHMADFNGVVRNIREDQYLITFSDANHALECCHVMRSHWRKRTPSLDCMIDFGINFGSLFVYKNFQYSWDSMLAVGLVGRILDRSAFPEGSILLTEHVQKQLREDLQAKLQQVGTLDNRFRSPALESEMTKCPSGTLKYFSLP